MSCSAPRRGQKIFGIFVDAVSWDRALERIHALATGSGSHRVCTCNLHGLALGRDSPDLRKAMNDADLVVPDGMPVAWILSRSGFAGQERIDGPGLMWRCAQLAEKQGLPVGLFGSTPATLDRLQARMKEAFPGLDICIACAPPYGDETALDAPELIGQLKAAAPALLFVGLGCPKQDLWMARNAGRLAGVMLGVGAAFDFHAGVLRRAPRILRRLGLEWAFRLAQEPRRLFTRYCRAFAVLAAYWYRTVLARGDRPSE